MLCECINSLLALSLQESEREIIVIDDGSDVSPMNGLMQYGDDIIYVRQKNGGVSVARNTGMLLSRGTYIQFIDGDDYLLPSPYGQCLEWLRSHQDADALLFDFTRSGGGSLSAAAPRKYNGTEYMRTNNLHGAVWCCLFRRSAKGNLVFTPGIRYGEDEEFMAQLLLRAETLYVTDAKAYFYRKHAASAIGQKDGDSRQLRLDNTVSVIKSLNDKADRMPNNDRLALQRRVAQLTMDYLYNTIVLTRSRQELDTRIDELYAEGLFPLPDRDYSQKYKWFRRMTNSSFGRTVLLNTLPFLSKER